MLVAVEGDVERSDGGPLPLNGRNLLRDARGQRLPPRLDADQGQVGTPRLLDDLVSDASERAIEPRPVQHLRLLTRAHARPSPLPTGERAE